jgi:hypothetical protein
MSHFTRVKTQITDLPLLKRALLDLHYAILDKAIVRGYKGRHATAEVVVRPGGAYDVGFVKDEDGSYNLLADWWGVKRACGLSEQTFLAPVLQRYAYHKVLDSVTAQGYQVVEETTSADQTVKLTVRRWR